LLRDHPVFGVNMQALLERAQLARSAANSADLVRDIHDAIEPWNLAGFGDPRRENWYPVDPQDLLRSASKVEASDEVVTRMLKRCGLEVPASEPIPGLYGPGFVG